MTPKELCYYILDGKIFNDIPSDNADFSELGRYTWPDRFDRLMALAKDAILTSAMPFDGEGRCTCYTFPHSHCPVHSKYGKKIARRR